MATKTKKKPSLKAVGKYLSKGKSFAAGKKAAAKEKAGE